MTGILLLWYIEELKAIRRDVPVERQGLLEQLEKGRL